MQQLVCEWCHLDAIQSPGPLQPGWLAFKLTDLLPGRRNTVEKVNKIVSGVRPNAAQSMIEQGSLGVWLQRTWRPQAHKHFHIEEDHHHFAQCSFWHPRSNMAHLIPPWHLAILKRMMDDEKDEETEVFLMRRGIKEGDNDADFGPGLAYSKDSYLVNIRHDCRAWEKVISPAS